MHIQVIADVPNVLIAITRECPGPVYKAAKLEKSKIFRCEIIDFNLLVLKQKVQDSKSSNLKI